MNIKDKYKKSTEKKEHQNLTLLPSLRAKAERLSIKVLGSKNFSGYIAYLINREEE